MIQLESIWARGLPIRLHKISVAFKLRTLAEELLLLMQPPCINQLNNFKEMYRFAKVLFSGRLFM